MGLRIADYIMLYYIFRRTDALLSIIFLVFTEIKYFPLSTSSYFHNVFVLFLFNTFKYDYANHNLEKESVVCEQIDEFGRITWVTHVKDVRYGFGIVWITENISDNN